MFFYSKNGCIKTKQKWYTHYIMFFKERYEKDVFWFFLNAKESKLLASIRVAFFVFIVSKDTCRRAAETDRPAAHCAPCHQTSARAIVELPASYAEVSHVRPNTHCGCGHSTGRRIYSGAASGGSSHTTSSVPASAGKHRTGTTLSLLPAPRALPALLLLLPVLAELV